MLPLESGWEKIAFCGSALVIIGVAFECLDLMAKCIKDDWALKWGCRLIFHPKGRIAFAKFLHTIEPFALRIELAGFALVVIGLMMELLGSTEALSASDAENRRLQKAILDAEPINQPVGMVYCSVFFELRSPIVVTNPYVSRTAATSASLTLRYKPHPPSMYSQ
jgi:hypothetical protein